MKNKFNLRKLIFILIGIFFCVVPIDAKAADYEVGFKFYKYDYNTHSFRTSRWLTAYQGGNVEEITDLTTIKAGDYVVIANTLKTIGNASAVSFSLYYSYDTDVFEITTNFTPKTQMDKRWMWEGGIFPDNETWQNNGSNVDAYGVGNISFGDSDPTVYETFSDTSGSPVIFAFLKAKVDITTDNIPSFKYYTVDDPFVGTVTDDNGDAITGTFASLGSTEDSKEVFVDTIDYVPEIKLSTDTTLKTLTIMNGSTNYTLNPAFVAGSTTTSYTLTVPYSVTNVDLQAIPTAEGKAVIAPGELGNKTLNVGANSLEFTVIPEDPDASVEIYTITVTRQNNVATLNTLTVDGNSVPGFTSDSDTNLTFTLDPVSSSSIVIAATPTDSNATVDNTNLGTKNLNVGDNTFTIDVTSEDGTVTKTYTIKVKRKSNVATLSNLTVTSSPQGTMGSFATATKTYKYIYDETVGNVTINATATHAEAMVKIGDAVATKGSATNNSIDPKTTNYIDVTITAEDGTTTDSYRINFEKKKSTVNTLKTLSVKDSTGKEYITNFNSTTKTYNITVANDITSLDVTATSTSDSASINNNGNSYTGTIANLGFSNNVHTLTVSPEDTNATNGTYTINVTRTKSANANLSDLKVDNTSLTDFDGSKNGTYTLNAVDSTKASVEINYTKENNEANVTITNNGTNINGNTVNLSEGNNVIVVSVTSQDNTKTIRHTINIKKNSSVATLSNLTATSSPQGTMGSFTTGTKTYTYIYDESVNSVTINATSTHNEANIVIGGNTASKHTATANIDPKNTTSIDIVITAEDGHSTDTYTINFQRKTSTDNTLKSLSAMDSSNNEYITNFNATTKTYTIVIPHDVTSLNVSAVSNSDAATINDGTNTYNGTINNIGFDTPTSHTITVKPEDTTAASATYTINVTREKSTNANLTSLTVDGDTLDGFNGNADGTYTLDDVLNAKNSVTVNYTTENSEANVTISNNGTTITGNNVSLTEGANEIKVVVTSQDGTKTITHTINIKRKSNNADLATLDITSNPMGTLSPAFDPATTTYTYNYDRTVTTINVAASSNHGATILGTGDYNIPTDTKAELTVTPEDGDIKIYTINFVQNLDADSTLQSLNVKNGSTTYPLTPNFSSNIKDYTLTVPTEVEKVNIEAIANNIHAKSITITKDSKTKNITENSEINLDPGTNNIEIKVIAEDDSSTTYTIDITRTINTSASLTDLKVDGVQIPDFSSSKTLYNLDAVDYNKTSIEIEAIGESGATVTGDGIKNLNPGDNTFEINVTAQDGITSNKYTINIRRKLNDAKITNLTSNNGTTLTKDSEFGYTLDIPSGITNVSLTPTFVAGATLKTPTSLDNIDITNITEIQFEVQAEDTSFTNTYTITLNKLASTNNNLASLSISSGTLDPVFNKNTTNYTVSVDSTVASIDVTAVAEDTNASITGDGTHNLNYGTNTITVTVTAEDNSIKDYIIVVTRNKSNDTSLSNLTIDGTTIAGFTSTKDNYEINLPFGTTSFELNATPNDTNANIDANELGTKNISTSPETFTFTVTAHDGTTKTYTIKVNVASNNDTTIDSLIVLGKTPTWNNTDNRYELTVDGETLKVGPNDINATFSNGATITTKDNEKELVVGANTYKFTVTAEDGTTTKEYEVLITREVSTINTLDSLTSDTGTISPTFDPTENNYTLTLPVGTTNFTLSATSTSKNPATNVVGTGAYTMPLVDNPIDIIVTAEDGSINTYSVTVKYAASNISTLDSLSVVNHQFNKPFTSTDYDYSIGDITTDITSLTINALSGNNATIKYQLNSEAETTNNVISLPSTLGEGIIKVIVTSEDDTTTKTYNIKYNMISAGLDKITSSIHTIDDDYVLTVKPNTQYDATFKADFDNDANELVLYLSDGTTKVTTEIIGTGMILKLERNGQVLDEKAIVILGDTSGDGMHDIEDAVKIVNDYLTINMLDGAYRKAADTSKDGILHIEDAVKVVNQYLGIGNLFGN